MRTVLVMVNRSRELGGLCSLRFLLGSLAKLIAVGAEYITGPKNCQAFQAILCGNTLIKI